jgi:ABC-type transport system involved in multi-copper enzyme maturation permease subunit
VTQATAAGRRERVLAGRFGGLTAVAAKELRGRMRGRRAFALVTLYVGTLAVFAVAVYQIARTNAENQAAMGVSSPFVSAQVGQAVFAGILLLETLIVVFLAPASTTGAISLEREKQTLDLLVVTPLSSLAIVLGKLFSALGWVLILVFSSVPLTAIVFVFGGVAPEDIARGYAYVLALAVGLGALGLFFSAAARRTQAATILSYATILVITIGTGVGWLFWDALAATPTSHEPAVLRVADVVKPGVFVDAVSPDEGGASSSPAAASSSLPGPPEALVWLNPLAGVADIVCGTDTDTYSIACRAVAGVTGGQVAGETPMAGGAVDLPAGVNVGVIWPKPGVAAVAPEFSSATTRDALWPQGAVAWLVVGAISVLLSVRLVRPGGRLVPHLRRRRVAPKGKP